MPDLLPFSHAPSKAVATVGNSDIGQFEIPIYYSLTLSEELEAIPILMAIEPSRESTIAAYIPIAALMLRRIQPDITPQQVESANITVALLEAIAGLFFTERSQGKEGAPSLGKPLSAGKSTSKASRIPTAKSTGESAPDGLKTPAGAPKDLQLSPSA